MNINAILQFDDFNFIRRIIVLIKILAACYRRVFDIFLVGKRLSEIILEYNIFERLAFLIQWCGGHFTTKHRSQFINGSF